MKFLINSITSQKDLNHVPHINDDQNTEIKLLHFFFNGLAYQQNISFNQIIFPTRCQPRKIITEYRSRVKTFARKSFVRDPHNSNKSTKVFWRDTKLDVWSRIVWAEWRVVTHWKNFFFISGTSTFSPPTRLLIFSSMCCPMAVGIPPTWPKMYKTILTNIHRTLYPKSGNEKVVFWPGEPILVVD